MATSGEKDQGVERDLRDETVALPPEELAGPSAAPAAQGQDPDATRLALDPDATRLADSAPTRVLDDDLPTIVVPSDEADEALPDGLDAMDDPYFEPAAEEDLTEASAPVVIPSPVQSLPERRRRLPGWAIALIVAALLALAGGMAFYTYEQELWGGKTVPAVVGMAQEDATRALEELGFVVDVEAVVADQGIGTVLACDPEPGTRADPAAGVVLSVASERVIPEVIGLSEDAARQALVDAGAQNIRIDSEASSEPAGTVISVTPGEGEPFATKDQVTLVVARAFTVPDVLGMDLEDAQARLEEDGLSSSVAYVDSRDRSGTVVETSPAVGEEVDAGSTIELQVAVSYPDEPYDLLAYLDLAPEALADYLEQAGFKLEYGEVFAGSGNAHAAYSGPDGELLQVSDYPESGRYAGGSQADVLSDGAGVGGARYAFSADTLPEGGSQISEEGLRAVMRACGFEGLLDSCTQDDIVMPAREAEKDADDDARDDEAEPDDETDKDASDADEGAQDDKAAGPRFICGYGRQGSSVWAVIIGGSEGRTSVVALVAPATHFSGVDLEPYGGSICDYVAYADLYAE